MAQKQRFSRTAHEGSDLADLINRFQGIADAEITLKRLEKIAAAETAKA